MAKEKYIPTNHGEGQAFLGYIVKTRNLMEGILMGGIPFFVVMYWTRGQLFSTRVTIASAVALPLLFLGLNGVNGDSLTVFFKVWFRFNRKRRVLFYNPRVKFEALPLIFEKNTEEPSPKEKIVKYFEKQKELQKKKRVSKNELAMTQTEDGLVFFEDDIGLLDKPDDYKTAKELRSEARDKKKLKKRGSKDGKTKEKASQENQ